MNTIRAEIETVKRERDEAAALRTRLASDLHDAEVFVQAQCKDAGLLVNVEACCGKARDPATGVNVAARLDVGLWVCRQGRMPSRANDKATCLFTVRWRPAYAGKSGYDDDREDPMPEGWCSTDQTSDRHTTAVQAIESALTRPATVRRVAEALIGLGA